MYKQHLFSVLTLNACFDALFVKNQALIFVKCFLYTYELFIIIFALLKINFE
jgi:hypothetical protein